MRCNLPGCTTYVEPDNNFTRRNEKKYGENRAGFRYFL